MALSDYYKYTSLQNVMPENKRLVQKYFSPIDPETGQLYGSDILADIIAEWSQFFFGDSEFDNHYHIQGNVPEFHRSIYRDLFSEYRFYYITAPSEFAKTTIACLMYPIYRAIYQLDPLIMIGGATQLLSEEEHLDNIKREFEYNDKLITFYGNLKPGGKSTAWSYREIVLTNGVEMQALGVGGRIRSKKSGRWRPTMVVIDDPENVKDTESEATLRHNRQWLKRDVVYRVDKVHGKVRLICTMLSDDCMVANVKKDGRWHGSDYAALDDSGQSIWPERWSTIDLLREREAAIGAGELDEWMFERMNVPPKSKLRSLDGYQFFSGRLEWQYEQNLLYIDGDPSPIPVNVFLGVDPEAVAEDYGPRAFITIATGIRRIEGVDRLCTFVLHYLYRNLDPSDIIDEVAKQHRLFHYAGVAIEKNAMQRVFGGYMLKYQAADEFWHKYPFQFHAIENFKKKILRILRLQPKCKAGFMFLKSDMRELVDEMAYFSKHGEKGLHLLDALEMADRISWAPRGGINTLPRESYTEELWKANNDVWDIGRMTANIIQRIPTVKI